MISSPVRQHTSLGTIRLIGWKSHDDRHHYGEYVDEHTTCYQQLKQYPSLAFEPAHDLVLAWRTLVPKGTTRLHSVPELETVIHQHVVAHDSTHHHHRLEYAIQIYSTLRQIDT